MQKKLQFILPASVCLLLFSLFFCVLPAFGQGFSAQTEYAQKSLQQAIKKYLKTVKQDPYDGEALYNLANAYRLNSEFRKAELWFAKAVQLSDNSKSYLYYAQMLLSNAKYTEAATWFRKYAAQQSGTSNAHNALHLATHADYLAQNGPDEKGYRIVRMPFNSSALDFSPMFYQDSLLVFASNREKGKKTAEIDRWTDQHYVDLYVVSPDSASPTETNKPEETKTRPWGTPQPFSAQINSKYHEGPAAFSPNYDRIYFTRNDYGKKGRGFDSSKNTRLKIFSAAQSADGWTKPEELPFNNREYHCAHPALSANEEDMYMVFASDMPGGYGQMDLYVVWQQDGRWGEPINLGEEINTAGNEVFPFLDAHHNLYFSSDFHTGLGGLDLFKAGVKKTAPQVLRQWTQPTNMGAPLNGNRDDFGIIIDNQGKAGYFTSNRSGRGDDIYSFRIDNRFQLSGVLINCKDSSRIASASVAIRSGNEMALPAVTTDEQGRFAFSVPLGGIYSLKASKKGFEACAGNCSGTKTLDLRKRPPEKEADIWLAVCPENPCKITTAGPVLNKDCKKPMVGAKVTLVNKCTGLRNTMTTGAAGTYQFDLEKDCNYILVAEKDGFFRQATAFSTMGVQCGDSVKSEIPMHFDNRKFAELTGDTFIEEGSIIELYNVYFDLDKYNIRADAASGLDEVYQLLLKYPEMKGEISAHTDSRAPFKYNEQLSENRAKAARQYLLAKGIDPDRLKAKGYGEYVLKNHCADNVPCSEAQHQRNRRVEFKVTYLQGSSILSKEPNRFKKDDF